MSALDISKTYGAILGGGVVAIMLSGALAFQILISVRLGAHWKTKVTVLTSWLLDLAHSTFICLSLVFYLIAGFGDISREDDIPWSIAFIILITAIQSCINHSFSVWKIHTFHEGCWFLIVPLLIAVFLPLLAASVSTVEMIRLRHFSAFHEHYPAWVFTASLSLSLSVDAILAALMYYFMRHMRYQIDIPTRMPQVIDVRTLWMFETGVPTCLTTMATLVCWLTMPDNLVFLGLHFVIAKLHAISFISKFNKHKGLRDTHRAVWGDGPILSSDDFYTHQPIRRMRSHAHTVEVAVERSIEQTLEGPAGNSTVTGPSIRGHYSPYSKVHLDHVVSPTILEWKRASVYTGV